MPIQMGRIVSTISNATYKLDEKLEQSMNRGELSDYAAKQKYEAITEFVNVLVSNFAYTFSEDSTDGLTYDQALKDIKANLDNWLDWEVK